MSTTLSEKTAARRVIDREWSPYLSSAERAVLGFIFTVTIEWSKPEDRLKVSHFVYGFKHAGATGLCDKTVRTALTSLELYGAITRKRTPYGYVTGINLDWDPAECRVPRRASMMAETPQLRAPKRPREIGKNYQSRSVNFTAPYREEHTSTGHTSCPSAKASDGCAPVGENSIQDRMASAIAKGAASKAKAVTRAAGKYSPETTARIWTTAFRETFPDAAVPAWTARETGQAKLFLRDMARPRETVPALEILDWCVRSWRLIMTARFKWMESGAPEVPAIGFMLAFKDRFYDAWNERNRLRQDVEVSGRERRMRRLTHQGLTREEAEAEAAAKDELAVERQKLAAERERLNKMFRQSEKRQQDLADTSRFIRQPRAQRIGPVQPKGDYDDAE